MCQIKKETNVKVDIGTFFADHIWKFFHDSRISTTCRYNNVS